MTKLPLFLNSKQLLISIKKEKRTVVGMFGIWRSIYKENKTEGIVGTHRMAAQDGSSSTTKTNVTGSQSCMIIIPFMVEDKTLYMSPYKTMCMG